MLPTIDEMKRTNLNKRFSKIKKAAEPLAPALIAIGVGVAGASAPVSLSVGAIATLIATANNYNKLVSESNVKDDDYSMHLSNQLQDEYDKTVKSQYYDFSSTIPHIDPPNVDSVQMNHLEVEKQEGISPIAEPQEDVAPSDPISTEALDEAIVNETAERDGHSGISNENFVGVKDSSSFGSNFPGQEQAEQIQQQNSTIIPEFSNSSLSDTVASNSTIASGASSAPIFNPSWNAMNVNTNANVDGVPSNLHQVEVEKLFRYFNKFSSYVSNQSSQVSKTYNQIKSLESEIRTLDNISSAVNIILTKDELVNKIESRMSSAKSIQRQLKKIAFDMKDTKNIFYMPLLAYSSTITSFTHIMKFLMLHPEKKDLLLSIVSTVLTPSLTRISKNIDTIKAKYDLTTAQSLDYMSTIVENYQDSDESERNLSKVFKFDESTTVVNNKFNDHMQKMFNESSNRSVQAQRKMREILKTKTLLSKVLVSSAEGNQKINFMAQQNSNTTDINTDNILQQYPRAPFGVKTPSRRLNLLETPLATKENKSIPYVNGYEQMKVIFS